MQSERNLVSAEGAISFTLKEAAHSSETMVQLHLTAWCHSPEDSIHLHIILLLRNNQWHSTGLSDSHYIWQGDISHARKLLCKFNPKFVLDDIWWFFQWTSNVIPVMGSQNVLHITITNMYVLHVVPMANCSTFQYPYSVTPELKHGCQHSK